MKYTSSLKLKLIYVFRINDEAHKNCLKIGETTSTDDDIWGLKPNSEPLNNAAHKRIKQYTNTAATNYELLYTEVSVYSKNSKIESFSDSEVHKVLLRTGIKRKIFDTKNRANEWFITDLETVKKAIKAVKEGKDSLDGKDKSEDKSPVIFRPEQKDAIEKTKKQFEKNNKMLWNAKMRFGKTLSALQVVKDMNFTRTLILTHRPVVDVGWFEDFGKIFYDRTDYKYGSKDNSDRFATLEKKCIESKGKFKYVYFVSMQDLRGAELVGGNFVKHKELYLTNWDLIIIDEAHEGTQTELGKNVINELKKANTKELHLSGTPFNLLDKYVEDEIYTWDYVMEQRAKSEWDKTHFGDHNPYSSLPRMNIYTYDLGKLLNKFIDETVAFNFHEFFRTNAEGTFMYQNDVSSFLNLICKQDKDSNYPYSTEEYRNNFRHSLWMVPGVKEARALSSLLQSHPVLGQFKIVNVAGDGDMDEKEYQESLQKVQNAISEKPHETYTITLSCGRLTTGVSVPAWTAVFMLSGSYNTSASSYMQTIFRVQTPAIINGKVKEECFVFDFAPDRTLKVIAETAKISAKAGKTTGSDRETMGEFLNFCPIISYDGSRMNVYDVNGMLEQLKKYYIERVVRNGFEDGYLYNNDLLMKLGDIELKEFVELKGIIGTTQAIHKSNDIDVNLQGFTKEEYNKFDDAQKKIKNKRELTKEEKDLLAKRLELKKRRDDAISILRGISIRMPLLIYGADVKNEDKELNIDNFTQLIDDKSWEEFMPKGVKKEDFNKFKKYYEQDIFRAAGKRIRAMARSADSLTVEERIGRITAIFNTFRNPDKETVLTPWRVVNMHLGDCLGGYIFFDEQFKETKEIPRYLNNGDVTKNVFDPNSRILEINSKSGLYPLFMAYGIYRSRIAAIEKYSKNNTTTLKLQLELWDKVVNENIFVICKTPMAESITKRTLAGFRNVKINAKYFEDLLNNITNDAEKFIEKVKQGKNFWKSNNDNNMKFNAIVGNPPYQVMDGGGMGSSAIPIYDKFVSVGKAIKPNYLSMIMPSRWFTGGRGLDEFRDTMLNDKRIKILHDYFNSKDCFKNVEIKGGICYFLIDENYSGDCEVYSHDGTKITKSIRPLLLKGTDTFIRYNEAISIFKKVIQLNELSFSTLISSNDPFGFDIRQENSYKRVKLIYKLKPFLSSVEIYYNGWRKEGLGYIEKTKISKNYDWIDDYKVLIPKAWGNGNMNDDWLNPFIVKPNSCCTETYLVVGPFKDEKTCINVVNYIQTKFFHFMVSLIKNTQNAMKKVYQFVPLQDFGKTSDIDWSKSISEIDKQLYTKYKLTAEEIAFIESMIKPME